MLVENIEVAFPFLQSCFYSSVMYQLWAKRTTRSEKTGTRHQKCSLPSGWGHKKWLYCWDGFLWCDLQLILCGDLTSKKMGLQSLSLTDDKDFTENRILLLNEYFPSVLSRREDNCHVPNLRKASCFKTLPCTGLYCQAFWPKELKAGHIIRASCRRK